MFNSDLREYAKSRGVFLYEVADKFGVNDTTFSKWLRKELSPEKKHNFKKFVDELASNR